MTRRLARVLESIAGITLAVAGVIGVLLWYVNSNDYRKEVAVAVEQSTGLIVAIDGRLRFTLRPIPTLIAEEVRVANPPWSERAEMARADRIEVGFAPASLLRGRPRIARLTISGAVIQLESDGQGRSNWSVGGESGASHDPGEAPLWAPDIERLVLDRTKLTWRDVATGRVVTMAITKGQSELPLAGPFTIKADGDYLGVPVSVGVTAGRLADLLGDRADWSIQTTVRVPGSTLELQGTIDRPLSQPSVDLSVGLSGSRLSALDPLLGLWLPPLGPYEVNARLTGGPKGRYELGNLKSRFGRSDLGGNLSIQLGGPRPRLEGRLTGAVIRLADLSAPEPPPAPPWDGRVFSDWPYPFDSLGSIDGRIRFEIDRLMTWPDDLTKVDTVAQFKGRNLVLEPFRANLTGGRIDGQLDIDATPRPTMVRWNGRADNLDLELLLPFFGWIEPPTGGLDVSADLVGRGESLRALLAGADGRADFQVGSGTLPIRDFDLIAADLVQAMMPWAKHGDRTQMNCMIARFDVQRGLARSAGLLIDTSRITIAGTGIINLGTEQMDMLFNPRPKDPSLISLATPMRVTGTLAQHHATPDPVGLAARGAAGLLLGAINPVALLVPFISMGTGVANPCLSMLHPTTTLQGRPPRTPIDGAVDFIDTLGQSLSRSLWGRP